MIGIGLVTDVIAIILYNSFFNSPTKEQMEQGTIRNDRDGPFRERYGNDRDGPFRSRRFLLSLCIVLYDLKVIREHSILLSLMINVA